MENYDELPKGMKKMPEEFVEQSTKVKTLTHEQLNYSATIRKLFESLEKDSIFVNVKKLEMLEEEGSPTLMSILIEIRDKK